MSGRGGIAGVLAAAAPLGMPSGKDGHHPGWKPLQGSAATVSQAGLQARAGSPEPGPVTRYGADFGAGFHRQCKERDTRPESSEFCLLIRKASSCDWLSPSRLITVSKVEPTLPLELSSLYEGGLLEGLSRYRSALFEGLCLF